MSRSLPRVLLRAFAAAATVVIGAMFVYAAVQQTYRTGADDPQIQLAENGAAALGRGAPLGDVVPRDSVEFASSLGAFVIVYGADDRPLAGSGTLEGAVPAPPAGVFDDARRAGFHRVTWQPRRGVRIAAVLRAVPDRSGRVVLAGRSLREVEERTSRLLVMTAMATAALMVAAVAAAVL